VVSANTLSKSLLRTVAGQIQREYPSVRYWPCYELFQRNDIFEPDGRHVKVSSVNHIVGTFLENYGSGGFSSPPSRGARSSATEFMQ
jgi:hypothetical protein